jgi:hypothetical protein
LIADHSLKSLFGFNFQEKNCEFQDIPQKLDGHATTVSKKDENCQFRKTKMLRDQPLN